MSSSKMRLISLRTLSSMPAAGFLQKPEVLCRVVSVVSAIRSSPPIIPPNAFFASDLGFDSMVREKLMENLEKEFNVTFPAGKSESYPSVESVVNYFASHPKAR